MAVCRFKRCCTDPSVGSSSNLSDVRLSHAQFFFGRVARRDEKVFVGGWPVTNENLGCRLHYDSHTGRPSFLCAFCQPAFCICVPAFPSSLTPVSKWSPPESLFFLALVTSRNSLLPLGIVGSRTSGSHVRLAGTAKSLPLSHLARLCELIPTV